MQLGDDILIPNDFRFGSGICEQMADMHSALCHEILQSHADSSYAIGIIYGSGAIQLDGYIALLGTGILELVMGHHRLLIAFGNCLFLQKRVVDNGAISIPPIGESKARWRLNEILLNGEIDSAVCTRRYWDVQAVLVHYVEIIVSVNRFLSGVHDECVID